MKTKRHNGNEAQEWNKIVVVSLSFLLLLLFLLLLMMLYFASAVKQVPNLLELDHNGRWCLCVHARTSHEGFRSYNNNIMGFTTLNEWR